MNYGSTVKHIRKSLRASQADIANINISRNLISSIEKGHTNLTPQKGLIIYERILEISLEKQKMITFNLDGLLASFPKYNHLKQAYNFCSKLYTDTLEDKILDLDGLEENLKQVNQYDIGLIKFFTYSFTARYFKQYSKEKSYEYYIESLEFLKWHYPLEKESLFSMTFNEATPIGYELEKFDTLSYYLNKSLQLKENLNIEFNVNHHYNLALFYNKNKDHTKSIEIANQYIRLAQEITTGDLVDALIIKAIGYASLGEIHDCIVLYEECIRMTENTEFYTQYALCLSNALYCIGHHKLKSHRHLVEGFEKSLMGVLNENISDTVSISNVYSNLAYCQAFLGNYETSIHYFSKAFDLIETNQAMSREISLLEECLETYLKTNKMDIYTSYIVQVDHDILDDHSKIQFFKLLIRLQPVLNTNSQFKDYLHQSLLTA